MESEVNLRPVVRAMNEHRDTYTAPGYEYVQCYLNGRRRLTVYKDGTVQIGRERIALKDAVILLDALVMLDRSQRGDLTPVRGYPFARLP